MAVEPSPTVPGVGAGIGHRVTVCLPLFLAGSDNLYDGIEDMIGYRPGPWMKYSWAVVTPVLCVVSFLSPGCGWRCRGRALSKRKACQGLLGNAGDPRWSM